MFRNYCHCFDFLEQKIDENECTKNCTGDSTSKCGARDSSIKSVYQTRPQATSPQPATSPQATSPQRTSPQATSTQATSPQATLPQGTSPQGTTPQGTSPQATSPQATSPQATLPQATSPQATSPQGTTQQGTLPQGTSPHATSTQATSPQAKTPQATTPQATSPQVTSPQATSPQGTSPQATSPQATSQQATSPQATSPQATSPQETSLQATSTQATSPQATTDGGWSEWGNWVQNGEFCIKNRTRTCTNPIPSEGGAKCISDGSSRVIFPGPLPDNFFPPDNSSTSYLNDSIKTSGPSGYYNETGNPSMPNGAPHGPGGQNSFPNNTGQIQSRQLLSINLSLYLINHCIYPIQRILQHDRPPRHTKW